jgi:hypothetical protein
MLPQGSSHAEGGIALRDNRTGRVLGEIEGGEPIISKKVYRANKSIVDALLAKGYSQDASPLPAWFTAPVASINLSRLSSRGRRFATGGILPTATDPAEGNATSTTMQAATNELMVATLGRLLQRLDEPIRSTVIYGEYEERGDLLRDIRISGQIA